MTRIRHISNTFLRGLTRHSPDLPILSEAMAYHPASLGGAGYRNHAAAAIDHFVISVTRSIQYASNGVPLQDKSTVALPPTLRRAITPWAHPRDTTPLFKLLHHLAPSVLPTTADTSTTVSIIKAELRGLSRHNYRTHQQARMAQHLSNAPPGFADPIASLLTPLTSLPLHSLPRHVPTNRLPTDIFRTLLQRKLRLPLLPPRLRNTKCTCGQPLDNYGDHFFSCRVSSKTPISNAIRDTVCIVLQKIAPLAGLCNSPHDVHLEPPQWLPNYPAARPADVGITLASTPSTVAPTPVNRIAIDVTVVRAPDFSLPRNGLSAPFDIAQRAHKAHHDGARGKFSARRNNHLLIHDLNNAGIMLLPFTVDLYGQLGYYFHHFLFPPTSILPTPAPPPWSEPDHFPHHPAFTAFQNASRFPTKLLAAANTSWSARHQGRYGDSHHCATPLQWATQSISLNVSRQLAVHINRNVSKQLDRKTVSKTKKLKFFGTELYVPSVPPMVSDTFDSDTCASANH